jgi:hypothetical protein
MKIRLFFFMYRLQIQRARDIFTEAESGVNLLDRSARWPVWSALVLYRQILDAIEANDYNNFTKRAYVPKWKKLALLPLAYAYAQVPGAATAAKARGGLLWGPLWGELKSLGAVLFGEPLLLLFSLLGVWFFRPFLLLNAACDDGGTGEEDGRKGSFPEKERKERKKERKEERWSAAAMGPQSSEALFVQQRFFLRFFFQLLARTFRANAHFFRIAHVTERHYHLFRFPHFGFGACRFAHPTYPPGAGRLYIPNDYQPVHPL